MSDSAYRERLIDYVRAQAVPPDKFSHQARLYRLAVSLLESGAFDDDVVFGAAWIHDLGVFVGHRPEEPSMLARWDHLAYVMDKAPAILRTLGFPPGKIPLVLEAVRTHMPAASPSSIEGTMVRDADILEQLGAVGILRTVSKVGRDTRFTRFSDALEILRRNAANLPGKLQLEASRREVKKRLEVLNAFLAAAESEVAGVDW